MDIVALSAAPAAKEPAFWAVAALLLLARIGPAIWITPFFGGALVPRTFRIAFALVLAVLIAPSMAGELLRLAQAEQTLLVAVLVKEVFVGAALAFVAGLVFFAAQSAGWLADAARGATMAEVLVPQAKQRSTAFGSLYFQLVLVMFFALGGYRYFLWALAYSYHWLPLGTFPAVTGLASLASLCGKLVAGLFVAALSWAAPVIGVLVVVDLAFGWLNRFAPQISSFFLAMPLKAALGVAVTALALGAFVLLLPETLETAMGQLERAVRLLVG